MKKTVLMLAMLLCGLAQGLPLQGRTVAGDLPQQGQTVTEDSPGQGKTVLIETTMGNIRIALYDDTPLHHDNFLKLVEEHYYDSLLFHRVIHGFMIQTGSPDSRHAEPGEAVGHKDKDYTIEAEIHLPQHFHKRGAVAAAREGDRTNPERRSSGGQFYIVWGTTYSTLTLDRLNHKLDSLSHGTMSFTEEMMDYYRKVGGSPHLDGQYTVFGEVVEGLDVVDKIQQVFTDDYHRPVDDVRIIRVTVEK